MRFLHRYNPSMLRLVATEPTADRFWSLEWWRAKLSFKPVWEGSLDVRHSIPRARYFVAGFGTALSLRYFEDVIGAHLVLWIGGRALVLFWQRTGI